MYRNSNWQNAKSVDKVKVEIESNKSLKSVDPYACAIKINVFDTWLIVGHIPFYSILLLLFSKRRW